MLYAFFALLLFPNLFPAPPPPLLFPGLSSRMRLTEKPRISALEIASPLLAKRFLPPKPNFSFFFCRLGFGRPSLRSEREGLVAAVSSRVTSKRSGSCVVVSSAPWRSGQDG